MLVGDLSTLPGIAEVGAGDGVPLVVDLDGTLIRTDLLHESVIKLVAQRPDMLLSMFGWLLRGKASFKRQVVGRAT